MSGAVQTPQEGHSQVRARAQLPRRDQEGVSFRSCFGRRAELRQRAGSREAQLQLPGVCPGGRARRLGLWCHSDCAHSRQHIRPPSDLNQELRCLLPDAPERCAPISQPLCTLWQGGGPLPMCLRSGTSAWGLTHKASLASLFWAGAGSWCTTPSAPHLSWDGGCRSAG